MSSALRIGLAAALFGSAAVAMAEELTSGPAVGESLGAFNVVKCAGPDDGVQIGQELCYR
jgi:hypothetical protein